MGKVTCIHPYALRKVYIRPEGERSTTYVSCDLCCTLVNQIKHDVDVSWIQKGFDDGGW